MIIKINKENPQKSMISIAAAVLKDNGIVVYPTDTVYGIGCSIFSKSGIQRIHRVKQRQKSKPMSFICRDLSEASEYARLTNFAFKVMKSYLPGPYTFILEATKAIPKMIQAKKRTVGIRIPKSNICHMLMQEFGAPITTTSANITDEPILTDIYDIKNLFNSQIDLYIDGGALLSEPSTIISLVDDKFTVLREGKGKI